MPYERRWLAVVALGLSLFLSALDATIVALALPTIAQHFLLSDSLASAVPVGAPGVFLQCDSRWRPLPISGKKATGFSQVGELPPARRRSQRLTSIF
jgi:MFS family permease